MAATIESPLLISLPAPIMTSSWTPWLLSCMSKLLFYLPRFLAENIHLKIHPVSILPYAPLNHLSVAFSIIFRLYAELIPRSALSWRKRKPKQKEINSKPVFEKPHQTGQLNWAVQLNLLDLPFIILKHFKFFMCFSRFSKVKQEGKTRLDWTVHSTGSPSGPVFETLIKPHQ